MNTARARVNDMMNGTEGDLLANDAVASQTYLTAAWRWYQARCDTAGVQTFKKVAVLHGLPSRANNDPANECWVNWNGCSDGLFQFDTPTLPVDMISPKSFWRRQYLADGDGSPSVNMNRFELMSQATDCLPPHIDCNVYDWRDDGLYFYGAHFPQDFKMSYSAYRPALDITRPDSIVAMMMCEDCLGARVAFEFANARGAAQAASMEAWAETAFNTTGMRSNKIKQRQSIRRQGYSGRFSGQRYQNLPTNG